MSQATTCPECRSRFQVSEAQLQAYRGLVRCGVCKTVFNARDHGEGRHKSAADAPIPMQSRLLRPSLPDAPVTEDAVTPVASQAASPAPSRQPATATVALAAAEEDLPPLLLDAIKPRHKHTALWAVLALLLVLSLASQIVFFNRTYLATQYPAMAPTLSAACQRLGCQVGLMQAPDQLLLETASLEGVAGHPGVFELNALLQNQANFRQAYPWLELTLTSEADTPVGRRIFAPRDYLPRSTAAAAGMPPHSETEVKLLLQLNHLVAAGYHVYLFFPAAGR